MPRDPAADVVRIEQILTGMVKDGDLGWATQQAILRLLNPKLNPVGSVRPVDAAVLPAGSLAGDQIVLPAGGDPIEP